MLNFSPIPSIEAVSERIKNGTSAPILGAISYKSSSDRALVILFKPVRTAAALLLPPPSPAPNGIRFLINMFILRLIPLFCRNNSAALQARLSLPVGIETPLDSISIPSPSSTSILHQIGLLVEQ